MSSNASDTKSLLNRARCGLLKGTDKLALEEFAELAVADDSGVDPTKFEACKKSLRSLHERGLITFDSETAPKAQINTPVLFVIKSPRRGERPHDDEFRRLKGDATPTKSRPSLARIEQQTIHYVTRAEAARVRGRLQAAGLWSEGLACWTGISGMVSSADAEESEVLVVTKVLIVFLMTQGFDDLTSKFSNLDRDIPWIREANVKHNTWRRGHALRLCMESNLPRVPISSAKVASVHLVPPVRSKTG